MTTTTSASLVRRGLTVALLATVLAACAGRGPFSPPVEETVPAALLASTLGIVSATAETSTSGFSSNLFVSAEFDRSDLTAADLEATLAVILDDVDGTYGDLTVVGSYLGDSDDGELLDLGLLGTELGFGPNDEASYLSFKQDFDEVRDRVGS